MDKAAKLRQLYTEMEEAAQSLPLTQQATDIIPGEGSPTASILFIGEAPGYHEHVQRRPFVGRSGKLLRKTILEETAIPDDDFYISNIVKARPPDNRDPSAEEIAAYKPYLDREIDILEPEIIVTLGRFSMAKFLPDVRISQVHGRIHRLKWNDSKIYVLPMYHPAAALRSGQVKQSFVDDMKKLPKIVAWIKEQQAVEEQSSMVKDTLL